jgi:adenylate cyclase
MNDIEAWLMERALSAQSLGELLEGICQRLVGGGMDVVRGNISLSIVDPLFRSRFCTWTVEGGVQSVAIPHERSGDSFAKSPLAYMFERGETMRHWPIDAETVRRFEVLEEAAALGGTDYLAVLLPFRSPEFGGLRGVAFTVSTRHAGGMPEAERAMLGAIAQVLAPIVYRITLRDIAVALMDAYVGAPASRRILNGAVRRGSGEPIEAVLMMADLSGFTALSDTSGLDLIERLDEHLEAMATPVIERGGSVLKFIGDGMLAIFPVSLELPKREACALALEAARDAIERNARVNTHFGSKVALRLDVALNHGIVFYGNVGAPGRLDFTVIGPAVNEVARMEALCGALGRPIIMSADVAAEFDGAMKPLGRHRLRGVGAECELFAPE